MKGHTAGDCQNNKGEIPQRFRHLTREAAVGSGNGRTQVRQVMAVWDDEPARKEAQGGQPDFA